MKYEGAYEAIQVEIPEVELPEETTVRLATHGKGNNIAYSYLMEACTKGHETSLVARKYKETWANNLLKLCETRLAIEDEKAVQRLVREFHRFEMLFNETGPKFDYLM